MSVNQVDEINADVSEHLRRDQPPVKIVRGERPIESPAAIMPEGKDQHMERGKAENSGQPSMAPPGARARYSLDQE